MRRRWPPLFVALLLLCVSPACGQPIPIAASITVPEKIVAKDVPAVSTAVDGAGQTTFTMSLVSASWAVKSGTIVTAVMEQTLDGGATWHVMAGFTATPGPAVVLPSGILTTGMPTITYRNPALSGARKVRITLTPSGALSVGATASSAP
jgi:hypothetical protein